MRARSLAIFDIMVRDVVTVKPETPIADCARLMRTHHVGSLVVTEAAPAGGAKPVGIVTDRDIVVDVLAVGLDANTLTASDIMVRPLATVETDEDAVDALARMRERGVRRLPAVDDLGRLAGIVTIDNVLEVLSEQLDGVVRVVRAEFSKESATRP
jgi:CBS domain-containing protein